MPVPIDFLRGMLGLLCAFFAHMLGRATGRPRQAVPRGARPASWAIRTVVTYAAILYRHGIDAVALIVAALAAAAFALGYWLVRRPAKPEEDLTGQIFHP